MSYERRRGRDGGGGGGRDGGRGRPGKGPCGHRSGGPGGPGGGKPRPRGRARFEATDVPRVWRSPYGVLTENRVPGVRVYGEKLFSFGERELRVWNPKRSKLAAFLMAEGRSFTLKGDEQVLYLGAASGTTVSHISDLLPKGHVIALERSARSFRDLIDVARVRDNVDPVLGDARATDRLIPLVPGGADIVYQDIAQRDQAAIFTRACARLLKPAGLGVLMVKARSVDLARSPEDVYDEVEEALSDAGYDVVERRDLGPWEKDHAALIVRRTGES